MVDDTRCYFHRCYDAFQSLDPERVNAGRNVSLPLGTVLALPALKVFISCILSVKTRCVSCHCLILSTELIEGKNFRSFAIIPEKSILYVVNIFRGTAFFKSLLVLKL